MKLLDLAPGDLFQFARQRKPFIHEALDGAAGRYRTIGRYVQGEPEPICTVAACKDPVHRAEHEERPTRAVHKVAVEKHVEPSGILTLSRRYTP